MYYAHFRCQGGLARTDQRAGVRFERCNHVDSILLQCAVTYGAGNRSVCRMSAGDFECRFSQPISRIKTARTKTARGKRAGETDQRLVPHRLRAVISNAPVTEIERSALLLANATDAQVVGKIGPATVSDSIFGNCLQPSGLCRNEAGDVSRPGNPPYKGCMIPSTNPMS